MAFMEQQITRKIEWLQLDGDNGTTFVACADVEPCTLAVGESTDEDETCEQYLQYYDGLEVYTVGKILGFGARLSAPGYLDCTEWTVFDLEDEAKQYLQDEYGEDEDEQDEDEIPSCSVCGCTDGTCEHSA